MTAGRSQRGPEDSESRTAGLAPAATPPYSGPSDMKSVGSTWRTRVLLVALAAGLIAAVIALLAPSRTPVSGSATGPGPAGSAEATAQSAGRSATRPARPPRLTAGAAESPPTEVPAPRFTPTAFNALFAQDLSRRDAKTPRTFYLAEQRSDPWASDMESQLQTRFSIEKTGPLGLSDLKLDKVDCRSSTCQVEFSWSDQAAASGRNSKDADRFGGDPLGLLTLKQGPLGGITERLPPEYGTPIVPGSYNVRRLPDGRYAATEAIVFGKDEIDPATYAEATERFVANQPAR
jgi:hypothetical protein